MPSNTEFSSEKSVQIHENHQKFVVDSVSGICRAVAALFGADLALYVVFWVKNMGKTCSWAFLRGHLRVKNGSQAAETVQTASDSAYELRLLVRSRGSDLARRQIPSKMRKKCI